MIKHPGETTEYKIHSNNASVTEPCYMRDDDCNSVTNMEDRWTKKWMKTAEEKGQNSWYVYYMRDLYFYLVKILDWKKNLEKSLKS